MSKQRVIYTKPVINKDEIVTELRNKWYNEFFSQYECEGLDYRQFNYLMKKLWSAGTIAAFKIKYADELGFAPWALQKWDMYGEPEVVNLINERGTNLIPVKPQVVDKDCVIGYIQFNRKPLQWTVNQYIDRIAEVECAIRINLQLQKMPYIITGEPEDQQKLQDLVNKIINNELAVVADVESANMIDAVQLGSQYVIDKLCNYEMSIINELKTVLGIDNDSTIQKAETVNMDQLNANNDETNDFNENCYLRNLKDFFKRVSETLGIEIKVKSTSKRVESVGERHNGEQPGPKEDNMGDEENVQ